MDSAFLGRTVAVSLVVWPTLRVFDVALRDTEVGLIPVTVTLQVAFLPLQVLTVMVAVPFFLAVSLPPETETTLLLLEDQVSFFCPA